MKIEKNIKDNFQKIKKMVKEYFIIITEKNMMVIGNKIKKIGDTNISSLEISIITKENF